MIKTKRDLEVIKQQQTPLLKMREGKKRFRIVVALGSEDIASKETLNMFIKTLDELKIFDCAVFFGPKLTYDETPVVDIHGDNITKTYIRVTKDIVPTLIQTHIIEGKILHSHVKGDK